MRMGRTHAGLRLGKSQECGNERAKFLTSGWFFLT
jgi:hypothetical protein